MKHGWLRLGCLAWLLAGLSASGQATDPSVIIILKNGAQVQGTLLEQADESVTIEEEFAGGTITQTTTIPRTNIAELVTLSEAETAARAQQRAYDNLQRYQLSPSTSYSAEYYLQVIDNVFRPFLEAYPDSAHAGEVAEKIVQWQAEYRQVAGGKAKYQGRWMDAEAARQQLADQHGTELMRQARTLLSRGAYDQAIEKVRYVNTGEARELIADAYRRWLAALDAERDKAGSARQRALEQIANGFSVKQQMENAFGGRVAGLDRQTGQTIGPTQDQIITLNRAQNDIIVGSNTLQRAEARLAWVERQVDRLRPQAARAGVPYQPPTTGPGGTVVSEPTHDVQAPVLERETDWGTPKLLRQMRDFGLTYWPALAIALVIAIWYATRKLGK